MLVRLYYTGYSIIIPDIVLPGEGPDIRQPGLDLRIIPGRAAVDDHLSMPPALVDGGHGARLDGLSERQLAMLDPELAQEDVDQLVGV